MDIGTNQQPGIGRAELGAEAAAGKSRISLEHGMGAGITIACSNQCLSAGFVMRFILDHGRHQHGAVKKRLSSTSTSDLLDRVDSVQRLSRFWNNEDAALLLQGGPGLFHERQFDTVCHRFEAKRRIRREVQFLTDHLRQHEAPAAVHGHGVIHGLFHAIGHGIPQW
jgi:hypothetical protein